MESNEKTKSPISFHLDIENLRERSKKSAWIIAGVATFCCVLLIIAIAVMMPLKEVQPYVIRVDNTTGYTDIVTSVKHKKLTELEVMDKYWISQYLTNREGYHYDTVGLEYRKTVLMTDNALLSAYTNKFKGNNSITATLGSMYEMNVKILSLQLLKSGNNKIAQVRIEVSKGVPNSGYIEDAEETETEKERYSVYLSYKYDSSLALTEEQRLYNPLGFRVVTYRLDKEVAQ